MKYKIVPDDIVKNMIEFLDEVQFEAAKDNTPDALHKINFCNWMISELMHSLDGFDTEDEASEDLAKDDDLLDRWDTIDNYRKDLRMDFPDDMSDEEVDNINRKIGTVVLIPSLLFSVIFPSSFLTCSVGATKNPFSPNL